MVRNEDILHLLACNFSVTPSISQISVDGYIPLKAYAFSYFHKRRHFQSGDYWKNYRVIWEVALGNMVNYLRYDSSDRVDGKLISTFSMKMQKI